LLKVLTESPTADHGTLTRPEDLLIITASRPSPFVEQIQASGKVEMRQISPG